MNSLMFYSPKINIMKTLVVSKSRILTGIALLFLVISISYSCSKTMDNMTGMNGNTGGTGGNNGPGVDGSPGLAPAWSFAAGTRAAGAGSGDAEQGSVGEVAAGGEPQARGSQAGGAVESAAGDDDERGVKADADHAGMHGDRAVVHAGSEVSEAVRESGVRLATNPIKKHAPRPAAQT